VLRFEDAELPRVGDQAKVPQDVRAVANRGRPRSWLCSQVRLKSRRPGCRSSQSSTSSAAAACGSAPIAHHARRACAWKYAISAAARLIVSPSIPAPSPGSASRRSSCTITARRAP